MRQPLILGLATLALGAACLLAANPPRTPPTASTGAGVGATAPKVIRKKTDQIRGFSMQLCDPSPAAVQQDLDALDELSDMGCTWINLVISAYQDNVRSEAISVGWDNTPSEPDILRIMQKAKSRGMGVMVMPIVLLHNSGPKDWRGVIDPPNWDNWFASYNKYITAMAKLAQDGQVDVFCVGSELLKTETFRDRWVDVITNIRKCYHGKLTYSANWDHYEPNQGGPTFWDQVDYIGMNNYNELGSAGADVASINKKWDPIKKKVLSFVAKENKPFMFTEVGWHNLRNTLEEPWNYVATGEIDHSEQLHAYQSFVDTWGTVSNKQFMGAFIWEWRPGTTPDTHGTYSLQGTPALDVVRQWMQSPDPTAQP